MESIVNKLQRLLMINWVEDTILQLKRLGELPGGCQGAGVPQEGGSGGENRKGTFCRQDHLPLNAKSGSTSAQWGRRTPSTGALGSSRCISGPHLVSPETVKPIGDFSDCGSPESHGVAEYAQVQALPSPPAPSAPNSVYFIWGSYLSFVWRNICCCQTVWKSPD